MAKKAYNEIQSGLEGWDADLNDNFGVLEDGPIPLFEGAAPPANQNDRGLMAIDLAGSIGWVLQFSDGTAYRIIPVRGDAVTSLVDNGGGGAADGTIGAITADQTVKDAITELATKINEILTVLRESAHITP